MMNINKIGLLVLCLMASRMGEAKKDTVVDGTLFGRPFSTKKSVASLRIVFCRKTQI
jgi:hypothetical protein